MAWTAFTNTLKSKIPSHPRHIIVAEEDVTHFSIAHPKRLPWFGSLLVTGESEHSQHSHHASSTHDSEIDSLDEKQSSMAEDGEPPLHRHHEAPVIQLFYDLFFVANLTTFTGVHEVNDKQSKSKTITTSA